jgi:hypothetical protein
MTSIILAPNAPLQVVVTRAENYAPLGFRLVLKGRRCLLLEEEGLGRFWVEPQAGPGRGLQLFVRGSFKEAQLPCSCPAYPFPHKQGRGKCLEGEY